MERCVSFGTIAEYEALEENDLKNGGNDKREVNENACCRSLIDVGGRKDELGEDDPEADSDEQKGTLGN